MDKSGWDWSVPAWLINLERDLRWELCTNSSEGQFKQLFDRMYERMAMVRVIFSDGEAVAQTVPSGIKSGHALTIDANSRMQLIIKVIGMMRTGGYDGQYVVSMGDDTIEETYDDDCETHEYIDALREMGFHIKDEDINISPNVENLNFCSQRTVLSECGRYVPVSNNWGKTLYHLRHKDYDDAEFNQVIEQMLAEFCYDEIAYNKLNNELLKSSTGSMHWKPRGYYRRLLNGVDTFFGLHSAAVIPANKDAAERRQT